jgi:hypothetical protein
VNLTNIGVLLMTAMLFVRMGHVEHVHLAASMLADYSAADFGERLRAAARLASDAAQDSASSRQ